MVKPYRICIYSQLYNDTKILNHVYSRAIMKSFRMTGNKISKQIIALPLPFTLPRCEVQILSGVTSRNPNPLLSFSKHKAVTHLEYISNIYTRFRCGLPLYLENVAGFIELKLYENKSLTLLKKLVQNDSCVLSSLLSCPSQ